ncbi:MAG: DUF3084 domain-containing protein [Synergistaceae bacterium]|nr:DUF3084 domain-containing protein [Synergistaceae bacterium]
MQPPLSSGTNWTLIVSIIAGSAVLAYLGDVLGSKYGKQRISLFGLRPKYTSRLITAFTGIFISVAVLAIMSFFSENVRGALFTLRSLQQEVAWSRERLTEQQTLLQTTTLSLDMARFDLETLRNDRDLLFNEKNDLEASISSLREDAAEMRRDLEIMRLGTITVQANSLLTQRNILPETSPERVLEILEVLEGEVRVRVADRRSEKRYTVSEDVKLFFDPAEKSAVAAQVANSPERQYVRVLAAENIAMDEEVKVRFESGASYLLYDEGEILYRRLMDPQEREFNAEDVLHVFLREVKNQAIKNGVLPDPATNSVGSLEGEDFFEVVEKLKNIEIPTIINAVALEDIYTEGPVRIKIILE